MGDSAYAGVGHTADQYSSRGTAADAKAAARVDVNRCAIDGGHRTDGDATAIGDDVDIATCGDIDVGRADDRADDCGRRGADAGLDIQIAADIQSDRAAVLAVDIYGRAVRMAGSAGAAVHAQVAGSGNIERRYRTLVADAGATVGCTSAVDGECAGFDVLAERSLAVDSGIVALVEIFAAIEYGTSAAAAAVQGDVRVAGDVLTGSLVRDAGPVARAGAAARKGEGSARGERKRL